MAPCLPIMILAAHLAAATPEASVPNDPAGQSKVVANRSSVPEVSPSPGAPGVDASVEDRPVERRGARMSRPADASAGAVTRGGARAGEGGWLARLQGLWPLIAVLALIGTLAWLARRLLPRQWRGSLGSRGIVEVLGRQHLSAKQSVALLKVGRRVVLVGMTADKITHLDTIADPDEVAELVGRSASARGGSLTSAFEREVLREAAAYEPSGRSDTSAETDGLPANQAATYVAARKQLRGLLSKVRSLTGT